MADAKKTIPNVGKGNTPAAYAIFPYLTKPDDKFAEKGQKPAFKTGLKLDSSDPAHAEFLTLLEGMFEEACDKAMDEIKAKNAEAAPNKRVDLKKIVRADTYRKDLLDEEGNATGFVQVNFKMPAEYKAKDGTVKKLSLPLFDAKGAPFPKGLDVWGGSKLRVNYEGRPYYNAATKSIGLTLRMNGVKVLELANGKAKDAASFGFDDEEEGFDGAAAGASFPEDTPASNGAGAAAGDEF